jgi:hypothetical protein
MRLLAMVVQAFAVVPERDDQRALAEIQLVERSQQAANLRVSVSDFAGVRIFAVGALEGLRRVIRVVRIVIVNPEEEPLSADLFQPVNGPVGSDCGAPLGEDPWKFSLLVMRGHLVIVNVKSLLKTELAPNRFRTHKGGSLEARSPAHPRQRQVLRVEYKPTHVAQLVNFGISAGEHAGVRRKGQRHLGDSVGEAHAARCQGIQMGSFGTTRSGGRL